MKGYDIRLFDDLIEWRVAGRHVPGALACGPDDPHAEGLRDPSDSPSDGPASDQAEGRTVKVAHRLGKQTELPALLPFSFRDVRQVAFHATPKREHQGEGMFGNRIAGIAPDIGDDDAAFEAGVDVDPVVAGGGYRNHAKRRQPGQGLRIKADLVDNGDIGLGEAGDNIGFLAVRVTCPPVFAGGPVQGNAGTDGVTVEMNDIQAGHD